METQASTGFFQKEIQMAQKAYDLLVQYLVTYGLQALYGLVILFIGFKVGAWVGRLFERFCLTRHMDPTLSKFMAGIVRGIVIAFAALIALEKFGITISPIIAAVSAMIFGASFALQAPLSNYAAGLSIVLTRPFKVGDTLTVKDFSGVVEDVKLSYTVLATATGEKITIPNKHIVGEVLINSHLNRMADTVVGISYSDDPEKAIRVIRDTLRHFDAILKQPEPQVGIQSFGDSSVNIQVRFWCATKSLVDTLHQVNLAIYKTVKSSGITIPFPQREVRMVGSGQASFAKVQ